MKQNYLKKALGCFMFLTVLSLQAQIKSVQQQKENANETVQLTEENQRYFEETGYVKCLTQEMEESLRQKFPNRATSEEFEAWLAPLVNQVKADLAAGRKQRVIYTIPVVVHVIHNGDAINTNGSNANENISDAQVLSQITVLNEDFAKLTGTPGNGTGVDTEIRFCMAVQDANGNATTGIVRYDITPYGNTQTPGDTGDWETTADVQTMKTNTQWDPTKYMNMWSIKVGGNTLQNGGISDLLGYAQFPSNSGLGGLNTNGGAANTDGVVAAHTTFGDIGSNDGSFALSAPYDRGRTMTHEVGHWLGLRHIWGDANCGDDFCADTPTQQTSSVGNCPNSTTCDGNADLTTNYMDYSNDSCMNNFTNDQKTRIQTVMTNSPRRMELATSIGCQATAPIIGFTTPTVNEVEGTSCAFRTLNFPINIALGASANATVTFSASGSATNMVDFEIMTPTATFASGSTDSQTLTIILYEDAFVEGDETIIIDMNLATTGDAELSTTGFQTLTLTITDEDVAPSEGGVVTFFEDDFESYDDFIITGIGDWITLDVDGLNTYTGGVGTMADPASYPNAGAAMAYQIFNPSTTTPSAASNSDGTDGETRDFDPRSGAKYAAAWAAVPGANPTNDDWLVSPVLSLGASNNAVSFWVKAMSDSYGSENYNVGVFVGTGTPTSGTDFTLISAASLTAPFAVWTEDTYDLSAYNNQDVRIGIHCISADRYMFMVDDFAATTYAQDQIQTAVNSGTPASMNIKGMGTAYAFNIFENNNIIAKVQNNDAFDYGCASVSVMRGGIGSQVFESTTSSNYVTTKAFSVSTDNSNTAGDATLGFYFTEDEIASWESDTGRNRSELVIFREVDGDVIETIAATVGSFGSDTILEGTFSGVNGEYYFGPPEALSVPENSFDVFALYPNPTNGEINVQLSTDQNVNVTLYDVRGRKVFANSYNNSNATFNKTINFETVSSGLYLIQFESGSKKTTKKLLIK